MFLTEAQENLTDYQSIMELDGCGSKLLCQKMPGFLIQAFQRSHKEPKPPQKMVKVLGGMNIMEEDPNDPEYLKTVEAWKEKTGLDFLEMALDYVELLDETKEQADYRLEKLEKYGMPNDTANRVFVFIFSNRPEDDVADIVKRISEEVMRLSTITPEEVEAAKANFRSKVDEHSDPEPENADNTPELRTRE